MKRWKLWLGILLIFLAGICIGAVGTGIYIRHSVTSMLQEGRPAMTRLITRKLAHELDLTEAQKSATQETIRQTQIRLWELRRQYRPEAEQIIATAIIQIKTELTPEQQEKLDRLCEKLRQRWRMKAFHRP